MFQEFIIPKIQMFKTLFFTIPRILLYESRMNSENYISMLNDLLLDFIPNLRNQMKRKNPKIFIAG